MNNMKKITESTKVTLTLRQLKKLVRESNFSEIDSVWDSPGAFVEIDAYAQHHNLDLDKFLDGIREIDRIAVGPTTEYTIKSLDRLAKQIFGDRANENTKVTLTLGQIRRLIKESFDKDEFTYGEPIDNSAWVVRSIKSVMKKYFEEDPFTGKKNAAYDPSFSAEDLIDEIVQILPR